MQTVLNLATVQELGAANTAVPDMRMKSKI